jgi:hypothetical protein
MNTTTPVTLEIRSRIEAVCDGIADDAQVRDLESLLLTDEQARKFYVYLLDLDAKLQWLVRSRQDGDVALTLPLLSTTLPGAVGWFSSGWPVAYLVATVIFGLGLLIGSLVHVSEPVQVARQLPSVTEQQSLPELKTEIVGRMTGMVDCKWADPATTPVGDGDTVVLGHKFTLASGLMEITYDTGAKVILQGPMTYEVESRNGGFMSLGKLTGKVTAEAARGLTIRTPTATITDLGTEFGVEVSSAGVTETQVFVGKVAVALAGKEKTADRQRHIIRAGQLAHIEGNKVVSSNVAHGGLSENRFLRKLPCREAEEADAYAQLVLSMHPVVYYRMELPEYEHREKVFDSSPSASHGTLHRGNDFGRPWVPGRFGKSIFFRGACTGDYIVVPNYPKATNNQLSVAAWVMVYTRSHWATIVANWGIPKLLGQFTFGMCDYDGDLAVNIIRNGEEIIVREGASKPLPFDQWQHVAFVVDKSVVRLYRNGVEVASEPCNGLPAKPRISSLAIGCLTDDDGAVPWGHFWNGRIDELAAFNSALSAELIRQLYQYKWQPPPLSGEETKQISALQGAKNEGVTANALKK